MYLKYLNTIFFANDIILWKCLCENTIFSKPFDSTARNLLLSECHANRSCFLLARLIYSYLISKKQKKKTKKKQRWSFHTAYGIEFYLGYQKDLFCKTYFGSNRDDTSPLLRVILYKS